MARRRKYGEDLTYAEWHREALPWLHGRVGHRQDMADRDWTEFCHHCKTPLAVIEEVVDRGQDINDKATTVTRRLAAQANVPAWLIAPRMLRPPHVQAEIDQLNKRIRELEQQYPIVGFKAKALWPTHGELKSYTPQEWAEALLIMHRNHHLQCFIAQRRREIPVNELGLALAKKRNGAWGPGLEQISLEVGDRNEATWRGSK